MVVDVHRIKEEGLFMGNAVSVLPQQPDEYPLHLPRRAQKPEKPYFTHIRPVIRPVARWFKE